MDTELQVLFYVGAALYLDLDSDEVDIILAAAGLAVEINSVEECRDAIRVHFPERHARGAEMRLF